MENRQKTKTNKEKPVVGLDKSVTVQYKIRLIYSLTQSEHLKINKEYLPFLKGQGHEIRIASMLYG